ncbi:hypothetical protein HGM15179_000643 [Zosterops borbonicus]|uniref:Uncharacterized protein n=1 Tax=Zosterops borbonicus TaxID=364589 RepID=A0A8K1GZ20_9PASS|nr:hypothetical protein HGM15179_000643 [Zosterops borbonicus]
MGDSVFSERPALSYAWSLVLGTEEGEVELGDSKLKIMGDEKEEKLQSTDEREKGIDEVTLLRLGLAASPQPKH